MPYLLEKVVPARDAVYWKMVAFCYFYNKKIGDFQWEILKELEIDKLNSQFDELIFIEKYNADTKGFNGIFAKDFQLQLALLPLKQKEYEIKEIAQKKWKDLTLIDWRTKIGKTLWKEYNKIEKK